jgi:hypothetical protein
MPHNTRLHKLEAALWAAECARIDGLSLEALEAEERAEREGLVRDYGAAFVDEFVAAFDACSDAEQDDLLADPQTFSRKMSAYMERWRRSQA